MAVLAIIGGTGFGAFGEYETKRRKFVNTPYGEISAPVIETSLGDNEVLYLPRHGARHTLPPHKINYRANLWALRSAGAKCIVAVAAVGGIRQDMGPGCIVIPDQIIDYTWGREHTLFAENLSEVTHIDFTEPYCSVLRRLLIDSAAAAGVATIKGGTYGATQGPRLETAMEINRHERDGCDMVGMTGMPEAALAKELGLCYACCAVVANWAAGRDTGGITMEIIEDNLALGMGKVRALLVELTRRVTHTCNEFAQ